MGSHVTETNRERHSRIPPGPEAKFNASQELLNWMGNQFQRYGDTYKASVYGAAVYVTRNRLHAEHVLRDNWRNYVKGQAIKRVGILPGNGLMVSEGALWKTQRRLIQPAFHRDAIESVTRIAAMANVSLLGTWEDAARTYMSVDVTADTRKTVLEVVLRSIFGDDYDGVRVAFNVPSGKSVRSVEFARKFRALGQGILEVVSQRRAQSAVRTGILGVFMEARGRESGKTMSVQQIVNEVLTLIVVTVPWSERNRWCPVHCLRTRWLWGIRQE